MTLERFIKELQIYAKQSDAVYDEVVSVGTGQGLYQRLEDAPIPKIYNYFCVKVVTKAGETKEIRVYADADEVLDPEYMTLDQCLAFDYTNDEMVFDKLLRYIPKETKISYIDTLNDKEGVIEDASDRAYYSSKWEDRIVLGVTGDATAVVIKL